MPRAKTESTGHRSSGHRADVARSGPAVCSGGNLGSTRVDACTTREIDGVGPEPVAADIRSLHDRRKSRLSVQSRCDQQYVDAQIVLGQRTRDPVQHPRATEIEPVNMRELWIVAIGDEGRP